MLKIVEIIGRIGGDQATEQLWNKIDFPDKVIVSQVLLALGQCGFKANISQVPRIKYAIESDIEDIAWNMAAMGEVTNEEFGSEIIRAVREEIDFDVEHIYMLLGMLYDYRSIRLVKENIESQTSEGVIYALELLDVFLSDDLKQRIIPVLDDLPIAEKSKRLEIFYPRESIDSKLVLKFLLNRDFSQTNRWTKTCILYQIGLLKIKEFYFDLISNLFNPDWLVREMAAWSLYQIDSSNYNENVKRLGAQIKRSLDKVIVQNETGEIRESLGFEKIMFLKSTDVLKGISGLSAADLVDIVEEIIITDGESIILDDIDINYFYVVYMGTVNIFESGRISRAMEKGEFIGELLREKKSNAFNRIVSVGDSVLLRFRKDNFYELLSDNIKLAFKIVEYV